MSRCYSYPPPGYQKKAQLQDLSVPPKIVSKEKNKSKEKDKEKEKKVKDLERKGRKEKKLRDSEKEELKDSDEKKIRDSEKEKKVKDSEKEKKVKDLEKEKKVKDPEKEKKVKGSEKEKKVKDPEKGKDGGSTENEKKENGGENLKERKDKEKDREKKDKEKNKDKDKDKERRDKEKRDKGRKEKRKDSGANGAVHDKDPRSSKLQRTSPANDLHSKETAGKHEIKTASGVGCPLGREGGDVAKPHDSNGGRADIFAESPSVYVRKEQPTGKIISPSLPLVLSKPSGSNSPCVEVPFSAKSSNHSHHTDSNNIDSRKSLKLAGFPICDMLKQTTTWSTVDDEEWLHLPKRESTNRNPKPKVEEPSQEVWAEALFLPSVGMYAWPYVVPN